MSDVILWRRLQRDCPTCHHPRIQQAVERAIDLALDERASAELRKLVFPPTSHLLGRTHVTLATKIAIVDHSTQPIDPIILQTMTEALQGQLIEMSATWRIVPPDTVSVTGNDPSDTDGSGENLAEDTLEIGIWDNPDVTNAAGYHSVDPRGKPYGKVFKSTTDSTLNAQKEGGTFSLMGVMSHEGLELWRNQFAVQYALRADGKTLDAIEECDAVEDVVYADPAGSGCDLSDYLLPSAFEGGAVGGPYDRQGVLQNPTDTTPGGYRIVLMAVNGGAMKAFAVYGPKHAMAGSGNAMHIERRKAKLHPGSTANRHRVIAWVSPEQLDHYSRLVELDSASRRAGMPSGVMLDETRRDTPVAPGTPGHESGEVGSVEETYDEVDAATERMLAQVGQGKGEPYRPLTPVEQEALRARIRETLSLGRVAPPRAVLAPFLNKPGVVAAPQAPGMAMAHASRGSVVAGLPPSKGMGVAPPPPRAPKGVGGETMVRQAVGVVLPVGVTRGAARSLVPVRSAATQPPIKPSAKWEAGRLGGMPQLVQRVQATEAVVEGSSENEVRLPPVQPPSSPQGEKP